MPRIIRGIFHLQLSERGFRLVISGSQQGVPLMKGYNMFKFISAAKSSPKSLVKSFFMNPMVHIVFRILAQNANPIMIVSTMVYGATVFTHALRVPGATELDSLLSGWPFLLIGTLAASVVFLREIYFMALPEDEVQVEAA